MQSGHLEAPRHVAGDKRSAVALSVVCRRFVMVLMFFGIILASCVDVWFVLVMWQVAYKELYWCRLYRRLVESTRRTGR